MREPRGLLFDYGGTILSSDRFDPAAGNRRLLALARNAGGVTEEDLAGRAAWLDERIESCRPDSPFEYPVRAFQRILYEHFALEFDLTPEEMEIEFWQEATDYRPEPGLREVLDLADSLNLPAGIVSNTGFMGRTLESTLQKHDLLDRFRFLISSADYGFRKPNPTIFEIALEKLGLGADQVWFSGNSIESDVAGAQAAGLTAVWYNRQGAECDGSVTPDAEVESWAELCELLRGAAAGS